MSTSTFRRFFGLLGWFLLVPSTLTALGAAWILASGMNMLGDTHNVKGRVVGHEEIMTGPPHRRGLAKKSIVEFVASDGRTFSFTGSVARQQQAIHKLGETVAVRYSAKSPSQAEISSSTTVKIVVGAVMLLSSAIGMVFGGLLLRLRPRATA
ncbi:uncharacterized protein DUF3592 [Acidovorax sp. 69]|uniref:DUF3592 domain-containing protein n=1 Tax=Acidovorax sp. 69 TaxID=2035202 RepID=UPI000C23C50E|nr:DUF3592 domain-containing protein [Acidovorax sp. 69]PJI96049.1 uncharacterized protein DUF3592 [Acidovorax sp. 69]